MSSSANDKDTSNNTHHDVAPNATTPHSSSSSFFSTMNSNESLNHSAVGLILSQGMASKQASEHNSGSIDTDQNGSKKSLSIEMEEEQDELDVLMMWKNLSLDEKEKFICGCSLNDVGFDNKKTTILTIKRVLVSCVSVVLLRKIASANKVTICNTFHD